MRRTTKCGPGASYLLVTPDHAGNVVGIDPYKQTLTATVADPGGYLRLASSRSSISNTIAVAQRDEMSKRSRDGIIFGCWQGSGAEDGMPLLMRILGLGVGGLAQPAREGRGPSGNERGIHHVLGRERLTHRIRQQHVDTRKVEEAAGRCYLARPPFGR